MTQEFHVVRCYACQVFQVQQVKKIPKWACKMCGEKQSLKKEYGRGSGPDCRQHVQKLNMTAGESFNLGRRIEDSISEHCSNHTNRGYDDEYMYPAVSEGTDDFLSEKTQVDNGLSRWHAYVDGDSIEESSLQEDDAHPHLDSADITLNRPVYQGRGRRKYGGWKTGRKRKREDLDQDTSAKSWNPPACHQNKSASGLAFKTTGFQNQENVLPDSEHPMDDLSETSRHSTDHKEIYRVLTTKTQVALCKDRQKSQQNGKMDGGTSEKVSDEEKQFGEVPRCSGSKWRRFLQDESVVDDADYVKEETCFQGPETKASIVSPNWSGAGPTFVGSLTSHSDFYTTSSTKVVFHNTEDSTGHPFKPVQFEETSAQKDQGTNLVSLSKYTTLGMEESVKTSRNWISLQGGSEKNVFSLEDEDILSEAFEEDW